MLTLLFKSLLLMLVAGFSFNSNAQFIRINIDIPPSFALNERILNAEVYDASMKVNSESMREEKLTDFRWLEIRTNDNVIILIENNLAIKAFISTKPLLYLNNGTNNLLDSFALPKGSNAVAMYEKANSKRKIGSNDEVYSAWLGIPIDLSGVIKISYP